VRVKVRLFGHVSEDALEIDQVIADSTARWSGLSCDSKVNGIAPKRAPHRTEVLPHADCPY